MTMKTDKQAADNQVELHSEKVRNIIGDIPSSLVRWGVAVIVIIVLGLLLALLLVPYPYGGGETIMEHFVT